MSAQIIRTSSLHLKARLKFKLFVYILMFFISTIAFAQKSYDWRSNIDIIVQQTDSLSLQSQQTFYLIKYFDDKTIRETWHYTLNKGKIIIFQIRFLIDSTEFTEIYYLNNGRLICMENYESEDFSLYDDQIKRGEVFFFDKHTLKTYVTVGGRKSNQPYWNRETAALKNFDKRYSELQKNMW